MKTRTAPPLRRGGFLEAVALLEAKLNVIIFEGGSVLPEPLNYLTQFRQAIVLDNITRAKAAGADRLIVVTDRPGLMEQAARKGALVVETPVGAAHPFHFGNALKEVCQSMNIQDEAIVCLGGGTGALMREDDWRLVFKKVLNNGSGGGSGSGDGNYSSDGGVVTANSIFSSDIIGFRPSDTVYLAQSMPLDNQLAWTLNEAGLCYQPLPRTTAFTFDIDTPVDAILAGFHPDLGNAAAQVARDGGRFAQSLTENTRQIVGVLREGQGEIFIFGRVSASTLQMLEKGTKCRVRAFIEERGMRALGREQNAFSMLGACIAQNGAEWFLNQLAMCCRAALIDTRVLYAHMKLALPEEERFYADLGLHSQVSERFAADLANAIENAPLPILTGGHSLVTGGLMVLLELASKGIAPGAVPGVQQG